MSLEFQEPVLIEPARPERPVFSLLPFALENDEEDEQEGRYENPGDRGHERSADDRRSAAAGRANRTGEPSERESGESAAGACGQAGDSARNFKC
jgi:hypothetical protein